MNEIALYVRVGVCLGVSMNVLRGSSVVLHVCAISLVRVDVL